MKHAALVALGLCGACSLHSLDYLDAGSTEKPSSGGKGAQAGSGGTGGAGTGAAGTGAVGASASIGGTVAEAGSPPGNGDAGAAGTPPELPDCSDGAATVDETDLDCGGRTCAPCEAEKKCITGSDCQSAICTNQICQPPTCTDLALNGSETDVNCGGSCPGCIAGRRCVKNSDCATGTCKEMVCATASCSDEVLQEGCPLLADNTPYAFSPSDALTKCIDDDKQSVADGTGMLLSECKVELHRTFWTMAQPDGYFALRNALSGKCLHVRGASKAAGAIVEQRSCTLAPEQLWKPSRVDANLMQLTAKHSGLVLDVAGDSDSDDGQGIVQGTSGNSADKLWHAQKRSTAAFIALARFDDQTMRMRHSASTVTLTNDDKTSAHWKVVPGLADVSGISLQSRDQPGRYLRHASYRIWADNNDGSSQFKKDATFRYASPFIGSQTLSRALESYNYPGLYLQRASDDTVRLTKAETTDDYKNSATWWIGQR